MRTSFASSFLRGRLAFFLVCVVATSAVAGEWKVQGAPFRAAIRLNSPPNDPEAGVAIELPDFGAHRNDLGDALLMNSKGDQIPMIPLWHCVGKKALFLAREMQPGKDYFLYFGGKSSRSLGGWTPKQGLLLETRSLGINPAINSPTEMMTSWNACTNVNGVGFVNSINATGNPFGESSNYASHYIGLYRTKAGEQLTFYTLSSDASFVYGDNRPFAEWPGIHGPTANAQHIHKGSVTAASDTLRIDYYQAKVTDGVAFAALGIEKDGKFSPVASDAWVHPGSARVEKIEQAAGFPVPCPTITYDSYIGFGGSWLYDVVLDAQKNAPPDWSPEWHFEDGAVLTGAHAERVMAFGAPQSVSLVYRKGDQATQGVGLITFPGNVAAASVKDHIDFSRYLRLLSAEKPENLSPASIEAMLPLLFEYANNDLTGRFASAWLLKTPNTTNPFWKDAFFSSIRSKAQSDPKKALMELQGIDMATCKQHLKELSMLELELAVFYLRDPSAPRIAQRVASELTGTPESQLALIRLGDYFRLTDQPEKAEAQYASVQKEIPDETGGRKLPAMDRSYSITIDNLLSNGMRHEADAKLREWELVHPLCKRDSDFLLLQARVLNSFGYWSQALVELESFKKTHLDSPYEIIADFFRAESLDGLGKKDEARQIRASIVKNFPNHELVNQCRQLLARP